MIFTAFAPLDSNPYASAESGFVYYLQNSPNIMGQVHTKTENFHAHFIQNNECTITVSTIIRVHYKADNVTPSHQSTVGMKVIRIQIQSL